MHQQRVRIQADRHRLAVKNRPVGRTRKSKFCEANANQFQCVYSQIVALLAELALRRFKPRPSRTFAQQNTLTRYPLRQGASAISCASKPPCDKIR